MFLSDRWITNHCIISGSSVRPMLLSGERSSAILKRPLAFQSIAGCFLGSISFDSSLILFLPPTPDTYVLWAGSYFFPWELQHQPEYRHAEGWAGNGLTGYCLRAGEALRAVEFCLWLCLLMRLYLWSLFILANRLQRGSQEDVDAGEWYLHVICHPGLFCWLCITQWFHAKS